MTQPFQRFPSPREIYIFRPAGFFSHGDQGNVYIALLLFLFYFLGKNQLEGRSCTHGQERERERKTETKN